MHARVACCGRSIRTSAIYVFIVARRSKIESRPRTESSISIESDRSISTGACVGSILGKPRGL